MKAEKGNQGYIRAEKTIRGLKTASAFGFVAALLVVGYLVNGTRLNWLTVVAVLACLPAAKTMVGLLVLIPYHSVEKAVKENLDSKTEHLTMIYEAVITNRDRIMPIDIIAVSNNTVCAYTHYDKVDADDTAKYLKDMLRLRKLDKVSVKIFKDYTAFETRAEGMNNIAAIDRPDSKEQEERIRELIISISI